MREGCTSFSIFDRSLARPGGNGSDVVVGFCLFILLLPTHGACVLAVNSVSGHLWEVSDVSTRPLSSSEPVSAHSSRGHSWQLAIPPEDWEKYLLRPLKALSLSFTVCFRQDIGILPLPRAVG